MEDARKIASIGLAKAVARSAYHAAFHAAEALILERSGKIAKTHSGVRLELARVAKGDPGIDRTCTAFLAEAYKYKEIGDYGVGPEAIVEIASALDMIERGQRFVDVVAGVLKTGTRSP